MTGPIGETGPTGDAGPVGIAIGTVGFTGTISATATQTFQTTTSVPTSRSIWGVEYEPTTVQSQSNVFFVSELYYTGGTANWDAVMTVRPSANPPGPTWLVGYTIHYSYQ